MYVASKCFMAFGDVKKFRKRQNARASAAGRPNLSQQSPLSHNPQYAVGCRSWDFALLNEVGGAEDWPGEKPVQRPHRILRMGDLGDPVFPSTIERHNLQRLVAI
jgi:hypothetical protein